MPLVIFALLVACGIVAGDALNRDDGPGFIVSGAAFLLLCLGLAVVIR
jgi:hypothetical protein